MRIRLLLTVLASMTIAACGGSTASQTNSPSPNTSPSPHEIAVALNAENGSNAKGKASVTIAGGKFTVRLHVTGLQAASSHPAHIHTGVCGSNGPVLFPLQNIVANQGGVGDSVTTIDHIYQVSASGWYINVHHGPKLEGAEATPIACGELPRH
jgi:hypothetical protein